jgi:type VI secretion system protein ImpH
MPSLKDKFAIEFFEFDFFQSVRLLEKFSKKRVPVGLDGPPAEEIARFRSHLSMAFPPSQIIAVDPPGDERPNPLLTVTFLGLYGPSGVLPTHYTQLLMDIQRDVRGPERRSLRDWFDLFDHRFISLFYRAWEKYRFYLQYDRGEAFRKEPDTFTLGIRSLMGFGTAGHTNRLVIRNAELAARTSDWDSLEEERDSRESQPFRSGSREQPTLARIDDLALLYYAGFFSQRPRNATNLRSLLADYFRLPIEVQQFRGQWLVIPESGQTRLGEFGTLGVDAIAGERVWNVQSRFRIRVGRLTYKQFEELLPDTALVTERKTFFLMTQLTRVFAGSEFDFDIQLVLAAQEVPEIQLVETSGIGPRLGWTAWLISSPPTDSAEDAVFEAEWVTSLGT